MGDKKRTLTLTQNLAIIDWLRQNWGTVQQTRPIREEIAAELTKTLGFPISGSSVASAVSALGYEWPRAKKARIDGHSTDRMRLVAGWVAILFDKMGEPRPPGMTEFIGGKVFDGAAGPLFNQPKPPANHSV